MDKLSLYFFSTRPGGEGERDIWVAIRSEPSAEFGEPSLVPEINSSSLDQLPTLTEDELIAFCREKLAAYKVPKLVEFMDELPKSTVGKVMRRKLKEMDMESSKKEE